MVIMRSNLPFLKKTMAYPDPIAASVASRSSRFDDTRVLFYSERIFEFQNFVWN